MSLGCAGCGDCCDQIFLPADRDMAAIIAAAGDGFEVPADVLADATFILEHWTPRTAEPGEPVIGPDGSEHTRYDCDRYDPVHARCGDYANRPPVCRGFPWYGADPVERLSHIAGLHPHPRCSYLLDVPAALRPEGSRPLIPLEVLRG